MGLFTIPRLTGRVWTVWQRNLQVFSKTWVVNAMPPFIEPVLYLLAIGFGLGGFIGAINGVPYVNFIAPALIAISAMNSSFFECTYGSYVRMYYQKTFDAIIATPVSLEEVIGGELLWGATRSLIYASLMLPVVILFRAVDPATSLLVIPVAFLTGLLFSSIAMCFTALAPSIDTLNYPSFLFITPMFLLSGTFFPVSTLPAIVQDIALILPLTHVVALIRGITLNAFTISMLGNLAWMAVVTPVVFLLSINLMKRRLIV